MAGDAVEAVEVTVAVIKTQLEQLITDSREAKEARKVQYQAIEGLALSLQTVEYRMKSVEVFIEESRPTLTEITALKYKAAGAGWAGHKLWVLATITISGAAWIWATWKTWTGH